MTLIKPPQPEPAWLKPFLGFCHKKTYDKHIDFIRQGEPAQSLYYLIDGSVKVLIDDEDRRELVIAYINKGEFIGEMGLFVPQTTRSVVIRTRTRCQVGEITYQRLLLLFETELKEHAKEILFAVGRQLSSRLHQTSRKVGHLAFLDVTGRIAGALLDLTKQPDAMTHPDGMQIRVTRQELGRIVGCSREMAGRVLKALEEQSLIDVKGKTIVVRGTR
ncbi:cAMP-activated global transcriptional regulator CRP [Thiococcus pfennigii]|jgi:CRP/FNR family cyclic AMP-dependent transcriptional regulator|uniref:cAMP-activated global transcriptional regulator CRP n=1 Tax=Thiococcus pfennigii TaxID=1057 RepID=UPI00190338B5|nr:cAMP-activated global transcriptional regulator CRP [Thiococcus pfennigii]MBK1700301.1 transcriptional regulator Crp [Thiococcus pfennigii]MBK1730563.1 transcriptional regulator Crp [Thiococcus pfennigii]